MRGLTITQPWAEAIASGLKEWETRSWRTSYRGPLAIHAAKVMPPEAREFWRAEMAQDRLSGVLLTSHIVAVAELADVRPTEEVALEIDEVERLYGDYTPGRWAWQLTNVRRLVKPIGHRGALGLWVPSDEAIQRIEERTRLNAAQQAAIIAQKRAEGHDEAWIAEFIRGGLLMGSGPVTATLPGFDAPTPSRQKRLGNR